LVRADKGIRTVGEVAGLFSSNSQLHFEAIG
jgi:hypothetical protein